MTSPTEAYVAKFFSKLNTFRVDCEFTDVTIECADEGDRFECHRLVLAMASDRFKGMLSEDSKANIILPDMSSVGLQELLRFIYTGDAQIDYDNFWDVFRASEYFDIPGLRKSCVSFVKQNMDKMSMQTFLNMYLYAYANKNRDLPSISQPYRGYANENYDLFSYTCAYHRGDQSVIYYKGGELLESFASYPTDTNGTGCGELLQDASQEWGTFVPSQHIEPILEELMTADTFIRDNPRSKLRSGHGPVVEECNRSSKALHVYVAFARKDLLEIFAIDCSTDACDYFQITFRNSFEERTFKNISLREVTATTFLEIMRFVYTGDARIDRENFWDIFRASAFSRLSGLRDSCISFMKRNMDKFTVQDFLVLYSYASENKKDVLDHILSPPHLEDRCEMFHEANECPTLPFDPVSKIIEDRLDSLMQASAGEEANLDAKTQPVRQECRQWLPNAQELDLFGCAPFENTANRFEERDIADLSPNDDATPPGSVFTAGHVPVAAESNYPSKVLHVYVKFAQEDLIRIFSIGDSADVCTPTGTIPPGDANLQFTTITLNDNLLYRLLFYGEGGQRPHADRVNFSAYKSADMRTALPLKLPPIHFEDVSLCTIQNNIYAYHKPRPLLDIIRTAPAPGSRAFTDEEIERSIFVYNCEVDDWSLVPELNTAVQRAGMTALDDTLYMIGGYSGAQVNGHPEKCAQAYDRREGLWRGLPVTENYYFETSACCLHGKIYVCGGWNALHSERYDPVAGKWERLGDLENWLGLSSKSFAHQNKIWLFNKDPIPFYPDDDDDDYYEDLLRRQLNFQTGMDRFDVNSLSQSFTWDWESVDLGRKNPTQCLDSVVFKKFV